MKPVFKNKFIKIRKGGGKMKMRILKEMIFILISVSIEIFSQGTDAIIHSQIKYFQKIYSLDMRVRGCTINSEELVKIAGKKEFQAEGRLFLNGSKYRVELFNKGVPYMIKAYSGEKQYVLQITKGRRILFLKRFPEEDTNPYLGTNIIVEWYGFVFEKGDKMNMEVLQNYSIWNRFRRRIRRIYESEMFGRKGVKVDVEKISVNSGKKEKYRIFFANDLNYFPIYWEETDTLTNSLSKQTLVNFKKYEVDDGSVIIIPLKVEGVRYRNKKIIQREWWEIDEKTLKINQPIKEEIFTIPISQADRVYDAETDTWFEPNK